MRSSMILALVLAGLVLLLEPPVVQAGAWTQQSGHGYAKVWARWLPGFKYMGSNGDSQNYAPYHEVFVETYGEYGVLDDLTLLAHVPVLRAFGLKDTQPEADRYLWHLAPGDSTLGARYRLLKAGRLSVSTQATFTAPLARSEPVQQVRGPEGEDLFDPGLPEGQDNTLRLRVGSGVWDVAGKLAVGYGWDRWYLAGGAGYILRSGGFRDVVTWSFEVGGRFSERWAGRYRSVGHLALELSVDDAPWTTSPSGMGNGTSYAGNALEADYRLTEAGTFDAAWFLGGAMEGGGVPLKQQTGGPVLSVYLASKF